MLKIEYESVCRILMLFEVYDKFFIINSLEVKMLSQYFSDPKIDPNMNGKLTV